MSLYGVIQKTLPIASSPTLEGPGEEKGEMAYG